MAHLSAVPEGRSRKRSPVEKAPTAVVIGAGFAGLAAARALKAAAFQVVVLESRNRVGGRVCTDHSFGWPVDMGASWLHGVTDRNPLAMLIRQLRLPLYRTSGEDSILYDHDLESYTLYEGGKAVDPKVVDHVGAVFKEMLEEANKVRAELSPGEDMSLEAALKAVAERRPDLKMEGAAQRVLQWFICRMEGWFAADAGKLSLQHYDKEELLEGGHGLMIQGYWPAVVALATGLDIRLKQRVREVRSFSGGVHITTDSGAVYTADVAVVALPIGVLKSGSVHFIPRLPEWKQQAMHSMGVGHENKVALLFKESFWPNVDFLGAVGTTSYSCSYFLNLHKSTGRPILVYMPAGQLSEDLESLSDDEVIDLVLKELRAMLPTASLDQTTPLKALVSHWGTDSSTLGAYSYDVVGAEGDTYEKLAKPVGPVYFAGEATSRRFPGSVHGAYASGLHAAKEIRAAYAQYVEACQNQALMKSLTTTEYEVEPLPLIISRL